MRYRSMIFSLTLVLAACGGDTGAETTTSAPETTTTTWVTTTTEATTTTTTTTLPSTTTTTTSTTTTEPLLELTQEIAGERLKTVARDLLQAFLDQDEEAYAEIDTALRDEIHSLLAEYAPLSAAEGSWEDILQDLGTEGVSHMESLTSDEIFWHPANTLFELYKLGVSEAPFVLYTGVYTVDEVGSGNPNVDDDATVAPGTYVAFDVEGCYWERLDQAGEINDNNFVNAAPRVEVSIRSTDFAFNSEDCAPWVRVGG